MENLITTQPTPADRFIALFIDLLIGAGISFILGFIPFLGFFGSLASIAYFLLKDALPMYDGQSVGKNLMKLKVIKEATGVSIKGDYTASITRNVSQFIPFYDALLVLGVVGEKDGKRLGDTWAGTKVVKI
ncbi:MAG: RDD family protein [Verrucomicrobia bacterium]|nr:RDD family protein [Cytophagales bacterium]